MKESLKRYCICIGIVNKVQVNNICILNDISIYYVDVDNKLIYLFFICKNLKLICDQN